MIFGYYLGTGPQTSKKALQIQDFFSGAEGNRTTIQCFKMPINTDGFKFCVVVRVVVNL